MSKMSRYVYRQIERGELPMELEQDEYSHRKERTNSPTISFAGYAVSRHASRRLLSRPSARQRPEVDWSLEAEGFEIPANES